MNIPVAAPNAFAHHQSSGQALQDNGKVRRAAWYFAYILSSMHNSMLESVSAICLRLCLSFGLIPGGFPPPLAHLFAVPRTRTIAHLMCSF